jgi:hypothetical protein
MSEKLLEDIRDEIRKSNSILKKVLKQIEAYVECTCRFVGSPARMFRGTQIILRLPRTGDRV